VGTAKSRDIELPGSFIFNCLAMAVGVHFISAEEILVDR
jgi:hypothetical protein